MELKTLIDQPGKLPTIPKVGQELIASFSSDDVSIDEIARKLAADPALSAKLLRLANSAFFHVSRTIGTVDAALQMLGFVMVRNLVIGNSVALAFKNTPGIDLKQFWRYNLYTACSARWLAQRASVNTDMVFTLGLMHAIGQLQMHVVMPKEVAPLDQQMSVLDTARPALERQTFGFHYGDVSAELAQLWNFPPPMIDALRQIAQPASGALLSTTAAWVHMGAWRASMEVRDAPASVALATYPYAVASDLGLSEDWLGPLSETPNDDDSVWMPPPADLSDGLDSMFE